MVRDRMSDLHALRSNSSTFNKAFLQDIIIQLSQNKKLREVLDEAEEIRGLINILIENISSVRSLHNNILSHTNKGKFYLQNKLLILIFKSFLDLKNELENRTYAISQTSFRIHGKLRDMGKGISIIDNLTINSAREGPAYKRIQVLQYTTMLKMFSDTMLSYNSSLLRYHDKCTLLLLQQRNLVTKHVADEELDVLLDDEKNHLFVDNILENSRIARQQLCEIQSRHDDILKLEQSITDVRDILVEMAFLIEKQGELLNTVEFFAGRTTNNIDHGRVDLQKAKETSIKHRKRKIQIVIIISIVIIILLLLIVFL
ncbi:syntaxin-1A-like isoform X1 [Prorops nasuta]|uniref:syntaxin-1A-like isoform X1 n=1 Tax=Prorops nasuta TaxID=863751 RepID=UPI0034CEC91B